MNIDTKITDEQKQIIYPVINRYWKFIQSTFNGGDMNDDYWDTLLESESRLMSGEQEGPYKKFMGRLIMAYNELLNSRFQEMNKK